MTCWRDRVALARAGWATEIRLSADGIRSKPEGVFACGFWARSSYWKGWISDIRIHDHAILDLRQKGAAAQVAALAANVREACERASRDFPDAIPCLVPGKDENGRLRLVENDWEMRQIDARQRAFFPTENIPEGLEEESCATAGSHLDHLIEAALGGFHVEDDINPYFGRNRYARDCKNRDWGYRLRLAMRNANGVQIAFRPRPFTVQSLHEAHACGMIKTAQRSTAELFASYAPGGDLEGRTPNGLPPGEQTIEEWARENNPRT